MPGTDAKSIPAEEVQTAAADADGTDHDELVVMVESAVSPTGHGGRSSDWPKGVLAGVGAALPIGWLLCYGALLPFFLGLFFFMLFGLLVGAVVFRVGQGARPIARSRIVGGTAVVVLAVMAVSLTVEGRDFPSQVGDFACEKTRRLPEDMTANEFRRASARQVGDYLSEHFAPGGVVGYFRWALTSGELKPPVAMLRVPFRASQHRYWWALRVVLCAVLLSYGVYSQVAPLAKPPKPGDRAGRAGNPLSKM